jgi:DNA-binding response OmpR family regulator
LTGNALDDDVTTFLEAGADCVIPKPLRAAQLDAIIQHVTAVGFDSLPNQKFTVETLVNGKCEFKAFEVGQI